MENYDNLSNASLRIKLKELENEYEALKVKVNELLTKMESLDKSYDKVKSVLFNRTKGRIE